MSPEAVLPHGELRRSVASRASSVIALAASSVLLVSSVLHGAALLDPGVLFLLAVSLAALASGLWSFGDRFRVDEHGLAYRNVWIGRFPMTPWQLAWSEIERASTRRGIIVMRSREGRKYVLDSLEDPGVALVELRSRGLLPPASGWENPGGRGCA